MKRFNRWFAAPVVFGALVVFSGCFAQTEPDRNDGSEDSNENVSEAQSTLVGDSCPGRGPNGGCTGTPSGTCCDAVYPTISGICRDLQNDKYNCGACDHVCTGCTFNAPHPVCAAGFCGCVP